MIAAGGRKWLALSLTGLLLAGCEAAGTGTSVATPAPPPPPPPPPVAAAAAPSPAVEAATPLPALRIASRLAGPETLVVPLPTAVVLLVAGDGERNIAFCREFVAAVPGAGETLASNPDVNLIQTFWPDRRKAAEPDRPRALTADACPDLVQHYDYARAAAILRTSGVRLAATDQGPVLMTFSGPDTGRQNVHVDLSAVRPAFFGAYVAAWRTTTERAKSRLDQPISAEGFRRAQRIVSAHVTAGRRTPAAPDTPTVAPAVPTVAGSRWDLVDPQKDRVLGFMCKFQDELVATVASANALAGVVVKVGAVSVCEGWVKEACAALWGS